MIIYRGKSMNYKVDVIIPTYKRSDMLDKAIRSILDQTYKYVMVTVVDDNDPDTEWRKTTSQMMEKYSEDPRVQYICHEKNKNGSAARNTGFKHTNGEFVCFLDDDDYFLQDKIRKQVDYLVNDSTKDACFCDCIKNGKTLSLPYKSDFSYDIFLSFPTPQTSGIMFRRKVIEELNGFDESYYRHQDYELLLRFYDRFSMGKVDEVLYVRERSEVDNKPNGMKFEKLKKKLFDDFKYKLDGLEQIEPGYRKKVMVYSSIDILKCYMKKKDIKNSLRILFIAMKNNTFLTVKVLMKSYRAHKIANRDYKV